MASTSSSANALLPSTFTGKRFHLLPRNTRPCLPPSSFSSKRKLLISRSLLQGKPFHTFAGLFFLFRRAQGGPGGPGGLDGPMDFGRSKSKFQEAPETGVTFGDVAGADQAKLELQEGTFVTPGREEMAALVVAVNPRVKFSDEQINAILDEVFRTYGEFIDGEKGLTYEGLLRTYDDGAGDVDRDFDALGLELNLDSDKVMEMASEASSSSIADDRVVKTHKKQTIATWAVSPNHGIVFDDTWKLVDDLEILVKRLKAKQAKDGKMKGDNFDVYSDPSWSRELGPSSDLSEKRVSWDDHFSKKICRCNFLISYPINVIIIFFSLFSLSLPHVANLFQTLKSTDHQLFKEALLSFKRACELQPTDVRPHFRASNCLYVFGRHTEATKTNKYTAM